MGRWVLTEERQPDKPGKYQVMRRVSKSKTRMDEYLWNGAYWVTGRGCPTDAVRGWFDKEKDESES